MRCLAPPRACPASLLFFCFQVHTTIHVQGLWLCPSNRFLYWMAALTGRPALPSNKCSLGFGTCATAFAHCLCCCVRSLRALMFSVVMIHPHGAPKLCSSQAAPWPAQAQDQR